MLATRSPRTLTTEQIDRILDTLDPAARYALKLPRSRQTPPDDVIAEAHYAVCLAARTFDSTLGTWADQWRTAVRWRVLRLRKQQSQSDLPDTIPAPAPVEPFERLTEGLCPRDRLILRRLYVDRDPLSTIGRDLDVPPRKLRAWVDSAHSRARSRLAMSA